MRDAGDRCPDNLLARGRRGPMSPVERRALDAHLGVCSLCRAAVVLGALADGIPEPPSEDDGAVVARLAARVTARARRGPGRARPVAIAAGIALMALAGAAAAWRATHRVPAPPLQIAETPNHSRVPDIAPMVRPAAAAAIAVSARPVAEGHRRHGPSADRTAIEAPEPDGPDKLFAQANAARGAGDLRAAAARYALLERQYPDSPEAAVSLVSAGDLLARQGDPAAALDRFDRYLARNGHGPLAPEALFGRARCLGQLGRRRDEADAWRALIEKFPDSLYERTARRRLDELRADSP